MAGPRSTPGPFSSSEAASETQTSSKKAKDSSIQGPSKDGSFMSFVDTEMLTNLLNTFHSSSISSEQGPDIGSSLSPNAIVSDWPSTQEEKYEEGASRSLTEKTRSRSSDDDRGQTPILSNLKTLPSYVNIPQESRYPPYKNTTEPGSPRAGTQSNSDISTGNRNPLNQTQRHTASTRVIANPPAGPTPVANTARNPRVGSSIGC